jgi:CubicO group peptidase (beta-lactamase class C family)
MLLNLGKWEGRQIVSEAWVKAATSVQVPLNIPLNTYSSRQRGIVGPGVYGYNWWTNGFRINGSRIWPGAPDDLYAALGFNTNRCFIIPSWNMVITRGGTDGEIPDEIENRIISDFFALLKEGTNLGLTQK